MIFLCKLQGNRTSCLCVVWLPETYIFSVRSNFLISLLVFTKPDRPGPLKHFLKYSTNGEKQYLFPLLREQQHFENYLYLISNFHNLLTVLMHAALSSRYLQLNQLWLGNVNNLGLWYDQILKWLWILMPFLFCQGSLLLLTQLTLYWSGWGNFRSSLKWEDSRNSTNCCNYFSQNFHDYSFS